MESMGCHWWKRISFKLHFKSIVQESRVDSNECFSVYFCSRESTWLIFCSVHLGVKPYACSMCDMRFFHRYHLQRHSLTHTGMCLYTLPPTVWRQATQMQSEHCCQLNQKIIHFKPTSCSIAITVSNCHRHHLFAYCFTFSLCFVFPPTLHFVFISLILCGKPTNHNVNGCLNELSCPTVEHDRLTAQ